MENFPAGILNVSDWRVADAATNNGRCYFLKFSAIKPTCSDLGQYALHALTKASIDPLRWPIIGQKSCDTPFGISVTSSAAARALGRGI